MAFPLYFVYEQLEFKESIKISVKNYVSGLFERGTRLHVKLKKPERANAY